MSASSTKRAQEIVGFEFQTIPLQDAKNLVAAGDGNYADLKAKLLDALPNLPDDQAFVFGLPNNKEVSEDDRRGICHALNMCLTKAGLAWRVTYSSGRRLFVCTPGGPIARRQAKGAAPKPQAVTPQPAESTADPLTKIDAKRFIDIAKRTFNGDYDTRPVRGALCKAAVNYCEIRARDLAPLIGLTNGGVTFNARSKATPKVAGRLSHILKALRNEVGQ